MSTCSSTQKSGREGYSWSVEGHTLFTLVLIIYTVCKLVETSTLELLSTLLYYFTVVPTFSLKDNFFNYFCKVKRFVSLKP